jgi:hypothetical protein
MLVAGNGLRMSNWVDWGERTGGSAVVVRSGKGDWGGAVVDLLGHWGKGKFNMNISVNTYD